MGWVRLFLESDSCVFVSPLDKTLSRISSSAWRWQLAAWQAVCVPLLSPHLAPGVKSPVRGETSLRPKGSARSGWKPRAVGHSLALHPVMTCVGHRLTVTHYLALGGLSLSLTGRGQRGQVSEGWRTGCPVRGEGCGPGESGVSWVSTILAGAQSKP